VKELEDAIVSAIEIEDVSTTSRGEMISQCPERGRGG